MLRTVLGERANQKRSAEETAGRLRTAPPPAWRRRVRQWPQRRPLLRLELREKRRIFLCVCPSGGAFFSPCSATASSWRRCDMECICAAYCANSRLRATIYLQGAVHCGGSLDANETACKRHHRPSSVQRTIRGFAVLAPARIKPRNRERRRQICPLFLLRPRMRRVVDLGEVLEVEVRVDLRRRDARVARAFPAPRAGRPRIAAHAWRRSGAACAGARAPAARRAAPIDRVARAPRRRRCARRARRRTAPALGAREQRARRQPRLQRRARLRAHRHAARLAAFAGDRHFPIAADRIGVGGSIESIVNGAAFVDVTPVTPNERMLRHSLLLQKCSPHSG